MTAIVAGVAGVAGATDAGAGSARARCAPDRRRRRFTETSTITG